MKFTPPDAFFYNILGDFATFFGISPIFTLISQNFPQQAQVKIGEPSGLARRS